MSLFIILHCFLSLVFVVGFYKALRRRRTKILRTSPFISVIVTYKNEAPFIKKHLNSLLQQRYNDYELLLVDDNSKDETFYLLQEAAKKHRDKIRFFSLKSIPAGWKSRKYALHYAVQQAKGDLLVFTDADCVVSPFWLEQFAEQYCRGASLIMGYSPYKAVPKRFLLSQLIAFDAALTMAINSSFIGWGLTYALTGRNWAIERRLWQRYQPLLNHRHIPFGSDDLAFHRIKAEPSLLIHPSSWAWSATAKSWKAFLQQKKRHLSAFIHYPKKYQWLTWGIWLVEWATITALFVVPQEGAIAYAFRLLVLFLTLRYFKGIVHLWAIPFLYGMWIGFINFAYLFGSLRNVAWSNPRSDAFNTEKSKKLP